MEHGVAGEGVLAFTQYEIRNLAARLQTQRKYHTSAPFLAALPVLVWVSGDHDPYYLRATF